MWDYSAKILFHYIQKLKTRDEGLSQGWGQIVRILDIDTKGGIQKMNCVDLQGAFRLIQSIKLKIWNKKCYNIFIQIWQN